MGLTAPYRQNHYMGEFASDAAALTFIQTVKWDSSGDGLGTPSVGMMYYNTTGDEMMAYIGSSWSSISSGFDAHNSLLSIQGGTTDEYYHLTSAQHTALVGGSNDASSLHHHDSVYYKQTDFDHTDFTLTDGTRAFTGTVGGITPTAASDLATKGYVDGLTQGLDWQDSTLSFFDPTSALPTTPSTGDRYVSQATANGWTANNIYTYNGSSWDETVVNEGFASWVEDEDVLYTYNGTTWVKFGSTVSHNNTIGLQGGTSGEYYHLTAAQQAEVSAGISLDVAYNHGATITVDSTGGDLTFDINNGQKTIFENGTDYLWLTGSAANEMTLESQLASLSISTNNNSGETSVLSVDAAGLAKFESTNDMTIETTGGHLNLRAESAGANVNVVGADTMLEGVDTIGVGVSSGATYGDAAINIGTGTNSGRTIVVGNTALATSLALRSGSGALAIEGAGEVTLKDQHLTAALALSQSGEAALDAGFSAASIVGALNELKDDVGNVTVTLDAAYDGAGSGAGRTITADNGAVEINGSAEALKLISAGTSPSVLEIVNNTVSGASLEFSGTAALHAIATEDNDLYFVTKKDSTGGDLKVLSSGDIQIEAGDDSIYTNGSGTGTLTLEGTTTQITASTGGINLSGGAGGVDISSALDSDISFQDGRMVVATDPAITFSQAGQTALTGFTATSVVGAFLELKTDIGAITHTLDGAYDGTGAGAGRAITADSGAVTITNSGAANSALEVTSTVSGQVALVVTNTADGDALSVNSNGVEQIRADEAGVKIHPGAFNVVDIACNDNSDYFRLQDVAGTNMSLTANLNTTVINATSFTVTGGGCEVFMPNSGAMTYNDQFLTAAVAFGESGVTGLHADLTATSIIGSINEVRDYHKTNAGNPNSDTVAGGIGHICVDTTNDIAYLNIDGTTTGWIVIG